MLIERILGIVPHLTRQMQERMAQAQARVKAKRRNSNWTNWSQIEIRELAQTAISV